MLRRRLRKQSFLYYLHLKYRYYIVLLTSSCIFSLIVFLVVFYARSNYIGTLLQKSNQVQSQPVLSEIIKNYQPRDFSGKKQSITYDDQMIYRDFNYLEPKTLHYKNEIYSNNIEILYRFPTKRKESALLLIFHSCRHSAHDWFHTPERQRIIGAAIDLGYICLVFQATDKINQCWSHNVDIYENNDIQMVLKGLEGFYKQFPQIVSLPRFTLGSSSGGIFSSIFAINQHYQIVGQVIHISIILPEVLYTYVRTNNYPATAWIHMLRDIEFASEERIGLSKLIFTDQRILYKTFPIEPISLTHTTFHQRIPTLNPETSRYIFFQLQKNHWLNTHNFILYNPRRKLTWKIFLFHSLDNPIKDEIIRNDTIQHENVISEFMNTAYGEHEISYERSYEALKWLKTLHNSSDNTSN